MSMHVLKVCKNSLHHTCSPHLMPQECFWCSQMLDKGRRVCITRDAAPAPAWTLPTWGNSAQGSLGCFSSAGAAHTASLCVSQAGMGPEKPPEKPHFLFLPQLLMQSKVPISEHCKAEWVQTQFNVTLRHCLPRQSSRRIWRYTE